MNTAPRPIRLIPLTAVATAPLDGSLKNDIATQAAVAVGDGVEVDLLLAEKVAPGSAQALARWYRECRQHWQQGDDGLVTMRTVLCAQQTDSRGRKSDLKEIVCALESHPELSHLSNLLERKPAWELSGGTLEREGTRARWRGRIPLTDYPTCLGGALYPGEVARWLELEVNHAAWRDRKSRRLVSLRVDIEETWPSGATVLPTGQESTEWSKVPVNPKRPLEQVLP